MKPTAKRLQLAVRAGRCRIGEIQIQRELDGYYYGLSHHADAELATQPALGGLDHYRGPDSARDISTFAEDGSYRFTKGMTNLRRGWVMTLDDEEELRLALDHFYPAAAGMFFALSEGRIEIQNLRDKLERQTGMYRNARHISDAGAQSLVRKVCGPDHCCAKRILWQIDAATPLEDSDASRYNGIPGDVPEAEAIPLVCREACNHFVAETRIAAKREFDARQTPAS